MLAIDERNLWQNGLLSIYSKTSKLALKQENSICKNNLNSYNKFFISLAVDCQSKIFLSIVKTDIYPEGKINGLFEFSFVNIWKLYVYDKNKN